MEKKKPPGEAAWGGMRHVGLEPTRHTQKPSESMKFPPDMVRKMGSAPETAIASWLELCPVKLSRRARAAIVALLKA